MNYNLPGAIDQYNQDQVRTQTMYEIAFHTGLPKVDDTLERMQVYGQNFTLPDRQIAYEDIQYRGYKIPVPTTMEMTQEHSITVYADIRGDLRRAMLDWQAACINPYINPGDIMSGYFESNRRPTKIGPGEGTTPTITIFLLAPDYRTHMEQIDIFGTRVVKVGGFEVSNVSSGISTFNVDLKSVYWQQTYVWADNSADENRDAKNGNTDNPNGFGAFPAQATADESATNF